MRDIREDPLVVSIYCTRASICVDKPGYLRAQKVAEILLIASPCFRIIKVEIACMATFHG